MRKAAYLRDATYSTMRIPTTALAVLISVAITAQDISGFLDYRNYFFAFDRGEIKELEPLPPIGFKTGGNYLAYVAANGDLKILRNGELKVIDKNMGALPTITDHYFGYLSAGFFKLYDGEELRTICNTTGAMIVEDSIAGFYDEVQRTMNIHYRGNTTLVEDALMENPLQAWSAGDNTIAWVSKMTNELKVFHRGEVIVLASLVNEIPFTAGLDMVAFRDPSDLGLKAYYNGEVIDVDPFMPERIHMGRGLFAYVDKSGALKVFQGGKVHTALDFTPDEFFVKDSLLVMRDKNYCKVFHNGSTLTVVPYWPKRWAARWGTFVWLDNDNSLQRWTSAGIKELLQRQPVKDITLDRGLLTAVLPNNQVKIIWHDQVYEH